MTRLRAAAGTRRGETAGLQTWSEGRTFPMERYISREDPALETARDWRTQDTI